MIGFVRGILAEKGDGYVVLDVNGIGFNIFVPNNSRAYLSGEGEEIILYTTMSVREDDISLYGFSGKEELGVFNKLISVSGVGAKAAMSILSAFTVDSVKQAIVFEDSKTLTKANGIGKKTAERIVLELKDKFNVIGTGGDVLNSAGSDSAQNAMAQGSKVEAVNALIALGYSRGEAAGALSGINEENLTTEEYIKKALKNLF